MSRNNRGNRTNGNNFGVGVNAPRNPSQASNVPPVPPTVQTSRTPSPVPACLFLERFTLDQREIVLARFYSSPATFPTNEVFTVPPANLVCSVRRGSVDTLTEFAAMEECTRLDLWGLAACLGDLRDNIDRHPGEAEALAQHVLETCLYRDIHQSESHERGVRN